MCCPLKFCSCRLIELWFYVPLDTNRPFQKCFTKPISSLDTEKKTTSNIYIYIQSKEMYYNTKKLKPGLVTFYKIWPRNGAGLFSKEKISKGGDK